MYWTAWIFYVKFRGDIFYEYFCIDRREAEDESVYDYDYNYDHETLNEDDDRENFIQDSDCPQIEMRNRLHDDGDEHQWGLLFCTSTSLIQLYKCCDENEYINIK